MFLFSILMMLFWAARFWLMKCGNGEGCVNCCRRKERNAVVTVGEMGEGAPFTEPAFEGEMEGMDYYAEKQEERGIESMGDVERADTPYGDDIY
jgi:hypothetical protein